MVETDNKLQQFYFYSHTNRRCIIQREENEHPAWDLEFLGTTDNEDDLYKQVRNRPREERFIVTTTYGKEGKREKVESREIPGLLSAISWASFIKLQNPRKQVNIWKIAKKHV